MPPDEPSPVSVKLAESLVLLEFLADLYPAAALLPTDPVLRARARHFVHHFDSKVVMPLLGFLAVGKSTGSCLDALEGLQDLLPKPDPEHGAEDGDGSGGAGFVVGQPSIADVAVAPFLVCSIILLESDIGAYSSEEGRKALEALRGPRLKRLMAYVEFLREWPAFKTTFEEVRRHLTAVILLMFENGD